MLHWSWSLWKTDTNLSTPILTFLNLINLYHFPQKLNFTSYYSAASDAWYLYSKVPPLINNRLIATQNGWPTRESTLQEQKDAGGTQHCRSFQNSTSGVIQEWRRRCAAMACLLTVSYGISEVLREMSMNTMNKLDMKRGTPAIEHCTSVKLGNS